jgi:hypothetical protein
MKTVNTITDEWRTDIENAPKDGTDVLFQIEITASAYWCKDLERWVTAQPLHMDFINNPTRFRLTP